jgi:predicted DNA-binding protein (MmcQ/YjbR family)
MNVDWIRRYCMSLPHTTETVQWGYDLVFKIGGKMYAVAPLEPAPVVLSFKCTPEDFAELTERPGIIPAPYMARAQWVGLKNEDALTAAELKPLLKRAYDIVFAKLPKKTQAGLRGGMSLRHPFR